MGERLVHPSVHLAVRWRPGDPKLGGKPRDADDDVRERCTDRRAAVAATNEGLSS